MIIIDNSQNADSDVGKRLYELFTTQFSTKKLSATDERAVQDRLSYTALVETERLVFESMQKNDGKVTPLKLPTPLVDSLGDEITIEWSLVPIPQLFRQSIADGDDILLAHMAHVQDLDQILVVSVMKMDRFIRLIIEDYTVHTGILRVLFDRIAQPQDISQLIQDAMVLSASVFHGSPVGAVLVKSSVLGVSATLNNTISVVPENIIFVEPGIYNLQATANGYETRLQEIQVVQDELVSIDLTLTKMEGGPLLVQSPQGQATFTILPDSTTTIPHLFLQQETPVVFRAEKKGFLPIEGQLVNTQNIMELRFIPEWMTMDNTLVRQKDAFYASLGRTLLLVGLSIGMESLSRAASTTLTNNAWQPAVLASAGLMGVSLTDTLFRLFAYYQKTQYISR
jgi:hypothetical protein